MDDELRKVVELLVGGLLFSGRERPTGQKDAMHEDFFKNFARVENFSSRLPYAVFTRLSQIVGWTRIELNKLFTFDCISEQSMEPIIRRFAVLQTAAEFFDAL